MKRFCWNATQAVLLVTGLISFSVNAANQGALPESQPAYLVEMEVGEDLLLPQPVLPDVDSYNEARVRKKLEEIGSAKPVIEIRRMFDEITLHDFTAAERTSEWAKRQSSHPKAIFIKSGVARLDDVYRAIDNPLYFEKLNSKTYIARLPLVI